MARAGGGEGGGARAEGGEGVGVGEREEMRGISLRLFFLDCNDYIAPLFIVLGRLSP
jgi:hypothetical protein